MIHPSIGASELGGDKQHDMYLKSCGLMACMMMPRPLSQKPSSHRHGDSQWPNNLNSRKSKSRFEQKHTVVLKLWVMRKKNISIARSAATSAQTIPCDPRSGQVLLTMAARWPETCALL